MDVRNRVEHVLADFLARRLVALRAFVGTLLFLICHFIEFPGAAPF
jgi:hypothetical protein